jgi:uncharacterized protein YbjT (DUF2867 family)
MKTLVIGGTGTVGSLVVAGLIEKGVDVYVLTRDAAKAATLPSGATGVVGDIGKPADAQKHFEGVDAVYMLNAASPSELYEGLMGVLLARLAGVKRFVYQSAHKMEVSSALPVGGGSKLPIENAVRQSGIPYTILRPNNFYQNDLWYKDAMLMHGIYPQPIGYIGMQRVDARDIAEAAVIALTQEGHEGKTYNIVGPKLETGPSCATAWSEATGKTIAYPGDDIAIFEDTHAFMGPDLVYTYSRFYEFYQEHGMAADPGEVETITALLGHEPRSLAEYAAETALTWR